MFGALSTLDNIKTFDTKSFKTMKKTIGYKVMAYKDKLTDMLGFGMGHLFRQTHELCLIGINNTGIYKRIENKSQRSVCFSNNEGHSIKPEVFQDSLEALFGDQDINKCELFGRRKRKGWDVIGNECPGSIGVDIEKSIMELIAK
jgi:N6-adenosine-specific RNA methylase IME4